MVRFVFAVTGLLLVLFLMIHLAGLSFGVIAPEQFELYASRLHSATWTIFIEFGLLFVTALHLSLSLVKVIKNSQAGNFAKLSSRRNDFLASFSARSQSVGGIFLLSFILIHLAQLRFPHPLEGTELEQIQLILNSPATFTIYIFGIIALWLHLFHGIESSQRSLGMLNPLNAALIRNFGRSFSVLISLGFVVVMVLLKDPLARAML